VMRPLLQAGENYLFLWRQCLRAPTWCHRPCTRRWKDRRGQ
jgi:hypothetical protein